MIYWPRFKPDKGWFFVMSVLMSAALLCLYWINSKKFIEQNSGYPLEAVGTVELYQPSGDANITCVPTEQPYSAKYTVGSETFQIPLGCASSARLHPGQQIKIWHSKENAQQAVWVHPDEEPSLDLIFGAIFSLGFGVLILQKGDSVLNFPGNYRD